MSWIKIKTPEVYKKKDHNIMIFALIAIIQDIGNNKNPDILYFYISICLYNLGLMNVENLIYIGKFICLLKGQLKKE